ncbi:MAG: restriction endonuclease subunit S [Bacteroidetes bacterium]|nr:restriction endonuclease subunit S [Bacteroidota bacterium]MCA6444523.1 restriction endonuclease subunit S [Bacteroidota bacterium]
MSTDIKLPKDWELKTLGDVCHTTSGGTPSRGNKNYYHGNIPWVKSGELDRGLILDTEEKITEEAIKNSSAKVFPKGTLLIALYGATIGKLAFLGVDAATNQAICGIYQNENIDSKFLYNYLFHKKRDLVGQGIGGAQPNISQTILKQLEIPLPPLSTQQAIVSKIEELFSELDNGIANLKTAQQQLKTYRQSVLKWAFEGRFTSPSPRGEGWGEVKDGELPMGWKLVELKDIVSLSTEKHKPTKTENLFYVGLEHIEKHTGKLTSTVGSEKITTIKNKFNAGDILYGKLRPNLNKCYLAKEDGVCSTDILVLKLSPECLGKYLHPIMVSTAFVNEMSENTSGVNLPRVPTKFILEYKIPLPPTEEQDRIINELESRLSVADKMEESITQSLQQAEALRQSILKKAFSGELLPSSPTLLLAEKGALNAQPVLSPSPSRRGTKGEVNVHKVESKKPNAKF